MPCLLSNIAVLTLHRCSSALQGAAAHKKCLCHTEQLEQIAQLTTLVNTRANKCKFAIDDGENELSARAMLHNVGLRHWLLQGCKHLFSELQPS